MIQLFRPKYEVEECIQEIRETLQSGWTGTGPKCKSFEDMWSEFTGAKHSLYLNSCTAALHLAIKILDLPKGSPIITTPITFVSTNAAILYEEMTPVFADVNTQNLSLSYESVLKKLEETGSKVVLWVHHGGQVTSDFELLNAQKHKLGITIIEDCAHAGGAFYANGERVGSWNENIHCFSYQSVKNMPTMDSGMLCTPTQEMHDRAKMLSWMGINKDTFSRTTNKENEVYKWKYTVNEMGWKYNGNDIAASIAKVQIKYLDRDNAYRALLYKWYCHGLEKLEDSGHLKIVRHSLGSSHHIMCVLTKHRESDMAKLKANGYAPGVHYLPNHRFPVFDKFVKESLIGSDAVEDMILSLPNHLYLNKKDVDNICKALED